MDLKTNIEKRLGTTIAGADDKALYYALLGLTKELCSEKKPNEGDRKVYYISAEFLIGKLLSNNLINLGVYEEVKELLAQNAEHKDWCCTEELMSTTKDGKALYLHCLPADINGVSCKDGEVEASVFDRYRDPLYKEASYKPYIIAAMIFLAKFENPQESATSSVFVSPFSNWSAARSRRTFLMYCTHDIPMYFLKKRIK